MEFDAPVDGDHAGFPLFPLDHREKILARVQADITRPDTLNVRRHRSYPRVVRRACHHHYTVKKPGQHGIRYDRPPTVRLTRTAAAPTVAAPRSHVVTPPAARRATAGRVSRGRLQQARRIVIKV
ncbi:hypothetical protein [Frankia sp. CiP3]|uniref:hypothetical protein n=1 Tax=Frankia sp. CiP3 TaxID=2880971 RepID=UPI001EF6EBA9|nr:hypothetical protein [Frankia sp. CiP3]